MWSIVTIRAFRDPGLCDRSTIERFPPSQNPPLFDTVVSHLVKAQSTTDGVPWSFNMATLVNKQPEQLIDWMFGVVRDLA